MAGHKAVKRVVRNLIWTVAFPH